MKPRKRFRLRFDFWSIVTISAFAFFLLFLVYPLFSIFINSFIVDGRLDFSNYQEFFSYRYYYEALLNSLLVAFFATIFACCLGIPLAYIMTRYDLPFKNLINILLVLTLMSPPFIGAYSWILMLGNNGFITNIFSDWFNIDLPTIYGLGGMIWVFSLQLYPHIYLYVSGALKTVDRSLEEASEGLGLFGLNRIRKITLPLIFPTVSMGAMMVFMSAFADFGTPRLLGQSDTLLPVLAFEMFINELGSSPAMASTISIVLLTITTSILFLQRYLIARKTYTMNSMNAPKLVRLRWPLKTAMMMGIAGLLTVSLIPQATVITTSFRQTNGPVFTSGFTLDSYREVFYRVPNAIINTFTYSSIAMVFMLVMGLLVSYVIVRRSSKLTALLDSLIMIPYVMPGTVLGISLILAFNEPPIEITGTWVILVIAYCIRRLPYTMRSSTAVLHQIDKSVEEASISVFHRNHSLRQQQFWCGRIVRSILSWVTTINELSSTIVLYSAATATISVSVYSEVFTSNLGAAAALASILTLSTIVSLIVVTIISGKRGLPI
ncbi:LOW QUALITY PROTEIN: ferric iron ABC transporter, permease protein [Geomicrobium sp. JCM 19037]|nr:LOW QUALITY PROTEIN: ferric iron ABC transporter, permease protein [Geomicrobium sp. JCM 19037]